MFIDYNNINELIEYMICFYIPKINTYITNAVATAFFIKAFKVVAICDMVILRVLFEKIRLYFVRRTRVYFAQKKHNHRFFCVS